MKHVVKKGESLRTIALIYGVSPGFSKQLNQLSSELVFTGDELIIKPEHESFKSESIKCFYFFVETEPISKPGILYAYEDLFRFDYDQKTIQSIDIKLSNFLDSYIVDGKDIQYSPFYDFVPPETFQNPSFFVISF